MKVCVVGVGNIGMRYVQGIAKTYPDAMFFLVDTESRLRQLADVGLSKAALLASLEEVREAIDLCVIATSCAPRLALYRQCLDLDPRYIILEKYLFKSRQEFADCLSLERVPTYVNQWMYGTGAFDRLFQSNATSVELTGSGWGLACNAVHWIDVFKRHMHIDNLVVGSETQVSKVFPAKRSGYEEVFGRFVFEDRDSERSFKLVDEGAPHLVGVQEIRVDDAIYTFNFKNITQGKKTVGHFPYLSEVIGGIAGDILHTGSCHLPLLEESIEQHLLIEDILETLDRRPNIT